MSCPVHSFSPDTRVTTAAGAVAIADIEVGDTVTARDPATGSVAEHTVSAVLVHTDAEIEYLRIDGETIETTPDHRFLTETGWVEAAALYPGTKVVKLDGSRNPRSARPLCLSRGPQQAAPARSSPSRMASGSSAGLDFG